MNKDSTDSTDYGVCALTSIAFLCETLFMAVFIIIQANSRNSQHVNTDIPIQSPS